MHAIERGSPNPVIDAICTLLTLLLLPGLIGSMGVGGNMHAFSLVVAAIINGSIYFGIGWLLCALFTRERKSKATTMILVIALASGSSYAQLSETEKLQAALHLYATGRLAEAEKSLKQFTRDNPSNVTAQIYLGQTFFKEGKFAEAVNPYEKVRNLEKGGVKLTLTQHRILGDQLAMAYGISGRSADAKALLNELVSSDPGYPLNFYNLACVAADENDKSAVLKNLGSAFEHQDQVLPGEKMPNPATDPSFKKYAQDADFKALLKRLNN
jgi:tetratricopeptide (TPR) repeat protein